jgi:hypothetical protein
MALFSINMTEDKGLYVSHLLFTENNAMIAAELMTGMKAALFLHVSRRMTAGNLINPTHQPLRRTRTEARHHVLIFTP